MKYVSFFIAFLSLFCGGNLVHAYTGANQSTITVFVCNGGPNDPCSPSTSTPSVTPTPTPSPTTSIAPPSSGTSSGGGFKLPQPGQSGQIGQTSESRLKVAFLNNIIQTSTSTARIEWDTNIPTIDQIAWGTDTDTSNGTVVEASPRTHHAVIFGSLSAETLYYISVVATSLNGITGQTVYGFMTKALTAHNPPLNVTNFSASPSYAGNIVLTWKNPEEADFAAVLITRATRYYPRDPNEGYVVYEGPRNTALDTNTVAGQHYYYTAFSENSVGDFSSGALTDFVLPVGRHAKDTQTNQVKNSTIISSPLFGGQVTHLTPASTNANSSSQESPITIVQHNVPLISQIGNTTRAGTLTYTIDPEVPTVFEIAKENIPVHTEQAYITTGSGPSQSNRFLFAIQKDGSIKATVPNFTVGTSSVFTIDFLSRGGDVRTQGLLIFDRHIGVRNSGIFAFLTPTKMIAILFILFTVFLAITFTFFHHR